MRRRLLRVNRSKMVLFLWQIFSKKSFRLNHNFLKRSGWTAQQVWMNLAADGDLKILVQSFKVFQIDYSAQTLIQDMGLIDL
jgi:hypothetical protein